MAMSKAFQEIVKTRGPALVSSSFIQNMAKGQLEPYVFGAFMNQESVLYGIKAKYARVAAKKGKQSPAPAVQDLLWNKADELEAIQEEHYKMWHISHAHGIDLNDSFIKYGDHYGTTANGMPRYLVTVLAARAHLWRYIAQQIKCEQDTHGVYENWIQEHLVNKNKDLEKLENTVETQLRSGEIDAEIAETVFSTSIDKEGDLLKSAI